MSVFSINKISTNFLFITLILCILNACERDAFQTGQYGECKFSTDTVMFDTVFTNIGTSTYKLIIKNPHDFKLEFDSVYLAKKGIAGFIINVNGIQSNSIKKISIDAKDSLYIFIQAYVPTSEADNPFINEDSIVFVSGNFKSDVKLMAIAQNVVAFYDVHIQSQEWNNSKPYLVVGTLTLDLGSSLTIGEGVKVYFHKNAKLLINGTLRIQGTRSFPVTFRSDRLEKDFDTIPGQWGGIFIYGTADAHLLDYAVIRNATIGIQLGKDNDNEIVKAKVSNTIISNMGYSALIAYQANISAANCVFANTVNSACYLYGGNYEFLHCTLANYGTKYVSRAIGTRTLVLQNYIEFIKTDGNQEIVSKILDKAYFGNTIIYGTSSDEIKLLRKEDNVFNYTFENCLLKISNSNSPANDPNIINSVINQSPEFIHPENENFKLDTLSFAKDAGKPELGLKVPFDLDNNSRVEDSKPDMGAYERKLIP